MTKSSRRRGAMAVGIVALWLAGVAALARRELFRGAAAQLAIGAQHVAPGAEFYAVHRDGRHVGWASSTIDTTSSGIVVRDVLVASVPGPNGDRRLAARNRAWLTRAMRLTSFDLELSGDFGPYRVHGTLGRDDTLQVVTAAAGRAPDTTRMPVHGSVLLPTLVPMALALNARPRVGRRYAFTMYDPMSGVTDSVSVAVRAESLFVIADSAALSPDDGVWQPAHRDTVRAWRLEQEHGGLLDGWIDERGRVVHAMPRGPFTLHRTAFELAYENWMLASRAANHHNPTP